MPSSPRVLVTGFSVFPGAPVNPTEALMTRWQSHPPVIEGMGPFRAETLAVEYAGMSERLSALGAGFAPDIAVHFGLAHAARGFRLERIARNSLVNARPDNAGSLPQSSVICAGPETFPSTLPLATIAQALEAAGLPVEWSDDAGGYLCNTVFTLSAAGVCDRFRPAMTGFVHVPALSGTELGGNMSLTLDQLDRGGRLILETCVRAYSFDA